MTIASTSTITDLHAPPEGNTLEGVMGRVRYQKSGFLIAEVTYERSFINAAGQTKTIKQSRSVKGSCLAPQPGARYTFRGEWKNEGQWGWTFAFSEYDVARPTSLDAIREYVQAAKWIGPAVADEIVALYKEQTLDVLREDPACVARDVRGVTLDRAQEISADLKFRQADEKILIALNEVFAGTSINKRQVSSVVEKWRHEALDIIRADPFALLEIHGIGFLTADTVCKRVGMAHDHPSRVRAGVLHVLREAGQDEGHTYLPMPEFFVRATKVLSVARQTIEAQLEAMQEGGELAIEDAGLGMRRIAHASLWRAENTIRWHIQAMLSWPRETLGDEALAALDTSGLAEDQAAALRVVMGANVACLCGPPGTGKTFLIRRILDLMPSAHVALCAPTGKASKRIYEQTGRMASTIHRALEPVPNSSGTFTFSRNEEAPIEADVVIVDESSMIDVQLGAALLRALRPSTRLILVGDPSQLPAVGPGSVLRDIIESGTVPTCELVTIKRQVEGALITRNCHAIRNGKNITIDNTASTDFFWQEEDDVERIADIIVGLVETRLPGKYGVDRLREIQVIAPLREKGSVSCKALNEKLQAALNPNKPAEGQRFAVGDKIICGKNQYDLDILNGDIGYIRVIDQVAKKFTVDFEAPERTVEVPFLNHNLDLAFAITCHRFQGSENKVIVIPIHKSQGPLIMQRPWLYTALSRGRDVVVVVGQAAEVPKIIARNNTAKRFTLLKGMLQSHE